MQIRLNQNRGKSAACNTSFASGGVKCKLVALYSETRPNAKPETVSGKRERPDSNSLYTMKEKLNNKY